MLAAGRTATEPEGCIWGLACETVGKDKGNIGHGGRPVGRFETLVRKICGIHPDETGVYGERGTHTKWRHGTVDPDRTKVLSMYQRYHFSVVKRR